MGISVQANIFDFTLKNAYTGRMKSWHVEFLEILRTHYEKKRKSNPRYSLRALARDLELSPGPTSALIKGTRQWDFSPEWALRVLSKIKVKKETEMKLRVMMGVADALPRVELTADQMENLFSKWYHLDVLMSFDLTPTDLHETSGIARRLGISEQDVQQSIEFLLSKNFLIKNGTEISRNHHDVVEAGDSITSEIVRNFHLNQTKLAQKALTSIPKENREFQTLCFAGNTSQLEEIRNEIRLFSEKIAILMSNESGNNEIFRFSVQLFPVNFSEEVL